MSEPTNPEDKYGAEDVVESAEETAPQPEAKPVKEKKVKEPANVEMSDEDKETITKVMESAFTEVEDGNVNAVPMAMAGISTIETIVEKYYPNIASDSKALVSMLLTTKSIVSPLKAIERDLSHLERFITDKEGNRTAIGRYRPPIRSGHILTDDAALSILAAVGLEGEYHVPLVNSGFRIQIKRASAEDRVRLDELLVERIGEIGRHTLGGSYLNTHSYITRDLTKFIMDHMTGHNIEGIGQKDRDNVLALIQDADYATLLNLMVVCEYPDGYEVIAQCGNDKKDAKGNYVCNHITTGMVKPSHLMKVDSTMLTDEQREQICYPMSKKVTVDEIKAYQAAFPKPKSVKLTIKNVKWEFELAKPGLADRIRAGVKWCDGINSAVTQFVEKRADSEEVRERVTSNLLAINELTNYLPYIKSIHTTVGDETISTDNMNAIHTILKRLIDEEGVVDIITVCEDLLTNQNPVIHGVPPHKCGSCGFVSDDGFVEVDLESQVFIQALPGTALTGYLGAEK